MMRTREWLLTSLGVLCAARPATRQHVFFTQRATLTTPSAVDSFLWDHFKTSGAITEDEKTCVQDRQLQHRFQNMIAVDKSRCKHGFPRAVVTDFTAFTSAHSNNIRLTCPHLVKEIDRFEAEGAIKQINSTLTDEDSPEGEELRGNFHETNDAYAKMRHAWVTDDQLKDFKERYPEAGEHFMNAGIIGVSPGKVNDAKCLHAHVADELLRGESKIGKWAIEKLEGQGVDIGGCDNCWQQCDKNFTPTETSWWYTPKKNKQKLRVTRNRRRLLKVQAEVKESIQSAANTADVA